MVASFDFWIPSEDLCGREDVAVQSRHFAARISMASRWRLCRCRHDLGWEEVVESHCGVGEGEKRQFLCLGGCSYLLSTTKEHDWNRKQYSSEILSKVALLDLQDTGFVIAYEPDTKDKCEAQKMRLCDRGKWCRSNQQTFRVTLGTSTLWICCLFGQCYEAILNSGQFCFPAATRDWRW